MPQETPATRDELLEVLAALEHGRWSDWQAYVHSRAEWMTTHGPVMLSGPLVLGWQRQIATPYADLTEQERDSDREQVMRYWPLLVEFVARWLETDAPLNNDPPDLAAAWREMMAIGDDQWRRSPGGE